MTITVTKTIENCRGCKHASHSGAFTKGGSINICSHQNAPREKIKGINGFMDIKTKEQAELVFNQRKIDYQHIPDWCPLRLGGDY